MHASADVSFWFNHKNAKDAKSAKAFHARAQRKGKEDGRLFYGFFRRVPFAVPTSPELQTFFKSALVPQQAGKKALSGL
jgi:hypothetical protein